MRKSLLLLLLIAVLGSAAMAAPATTRAATFHDGDYMLIGVPDLPQAVAFFQDILGCQSIDPTAPVVSTQDSRLLSCEADQIIELSASRGAASPAFVSATSADDTPVQFFADDAASVGNWLKHEGVRMLGPPHTLRAGPHAGQLAVDFLSPWGLHMRVVSWHTNTITAGP